MTSTKKQPTYLRSQRRRRKCLTFIYRCVENLPDTAVLQAIALDQVKRLGHAASSVLIDDADTCRALQATVGFAIRVRFDATMAEAFCGFALIPGTSPAGPTAMAQQFAAARLDLIGALRKYAGALTLPEQAAIRKAAAVLACTYPSIRAGHAANGIEYLKGLGAHPLQVKRMRDAVVQGLNYRLPPIPQMV